MSDAHVAELEAAIKELEDEVEFKTIAMTSMRKTEELLAAQRDAERAAGAVAALENVALKAEIAELRLRIEKMREGDWEEK